MKKKCMTIFILSMFLGLISPYNVYGDSISSIILDKSKEEIEVYKELTEIKEINTYLNYDEFENIKDLEYYQWLLKIKEIDYFLDEYYSNYDDKSEIDKEILNENLTILNNIINYLDENFYSQDLIENGIKDKIENLNENLNENQVVDFYEIKDILQNIILSYKNHEDYIDNIFQENKEFQEEYIEDKEIDEIIKTGDNYCEGIMYTEDICDLDGSENINDGEETLIETDLSQNILSTREIVGSYKGEDVSIKEELNILKANIQDSAENKDVDYKVNALDLEVTKDSNNKLKITFKIDSDLDLKNENNDLKIYIGNKSGNNTEILIIKNKTLDKYLYLENVTNLSGGALKLGKDDTLLDGVYAVILSDEEEEKLRDVGLENLVIKVEAIFNNKPSSLVGYLKGNTMEGSSSEDIQEKESEESNSIITSTNNEKSESSVKDVLPKTGMFLERYLILVVGILSILLGSFLVRHKKIGS